MVLLQAMTSALPTSALGGPRGPAETIARGHNGVLIAARSQLPDISESP